MLKRNRTLKVLNLSENKLDVQGLIAVAEALVCYTMTCLSGISDVGQKYNSCLETLDLSKNPCCGPGLEGVRVNPYSISPPLTGSSIRSNHCGQPSL